jgi:hypothetical protein
MNHRGSDSICPTSPDSFFVVEPGRKRKFSDSINGKFVPQFINSLGFRSRLPALVVHRLVFPVLDRAHAMHAAHVMS